MTRKEFGIFLAKDAARRGIGLDMIARNSDIPSYKLHKASVGAYELSYKEIKRIVLYLRYSPKQPPFNERSKTKVCDICGSRQHKQGCPYYEPFSLHRCDLCGQAIVEGEDYIRIPGEELGRNKEDLLICRECAGKHTKYA